MSLTKNVEEVLHRIRGQLYPNYLPDKGGKYIIRTKNEPAQDVEQICASLKNRGGSTASYDDLVQHAKEYDDERMYLLANGFPVRNKYYTLRPHAGGTIDSPDAKPDPVNNKCYATFHPMDAMRSLFSHVTLFIDGLANVDGYVDHVKDVFSDTIDDIITENGPLIVHGHKICVKGDSPLVGVFFTRGSGVVQVSAPFTENSANKLILTVPDLAGGVWRLKIVTQFTNGTRLLKEPRTIIFDQDLRVLR
jgi:hypothetical protein